MLRVWPLSSSSVRFLETRRFSLRATVGNDIIRTIISRSKFAKSLAASKSRFHEARKLQQEGLAEDIRNCASLILLLGGKHEVVF
jgi:hypothetical protein